MRKKTRGLLLTLEGIDGSGKTTLAGKLEKWLGKNVIGVPVIRTREPGGCETAEKLRKVILTGKLSPVAEVFTFMAGRAENVEKVIKPALTSGYIVICDRFGDSSVAYQGGGLGLGMPLIDALNQHVIGDCVPDMTFLLAGSASVLLARIPDGKKDGIEKRPDGFFDAIGTHYEFAARREPSRFRILDAEAAPEDVFNQAVGFLTDKLRERGFPVLLNVGGEALAVQANIEIARAEYLKAATINPDEAITALTKE
jgi:dTMP kinase